MSKSEKLQKTILEGIKDFRNNPLGDSDDVCLSFFLTGWLKNQVSLKSEKSYLKLRIKDIVEGRK